MRAFAVVPLASLGMMVSSVATTCDARTRAAITRNTLTPAELSAPLQLDVAFAMRDFSGLLAKDMKRPNLDGVLVTSVRPGGPAGGAKPAIEARDVLLEVSGQPVKDVHALKELTRKVTEGQTAPVPVIATFERKAARYFAVVKVGIEDLKDPGLEVTKAWLPVETHVISRDIAKQLGHNLMTFAVPFAMFQEMEANVPGSFLERDTWRELRDAAT